MSVRTSDSSDFYISDCWKCLELFVSVNVFYSMSTT